MIFRESVFKKHREMMFPHIKDWKNYKHKFSSESINEISYKEWFWFDRSAFWLFVYGMAGFMVLNCIIGIYIFTFVYPNSIFQIIDAFLLLIFTHHLYKEIKKWPIYKYKTMFDLYMRDYDEDE